MGEVKQINSNKFIDRTGMRYGRLTVVKRAENKKIGNNTRTMWECKCDCGNTVIVRSDSLNDGTTRSCGCLQRDWIKQLGQHVDECKLTRGGESRGRLFNIWYLMKYRCQNPKSKAFNNYGGRGITVCDEWSDNENGYNAFKDWALNNGYFESACIDRIDNDAGYSPKNCRWVDDYIQANNKRNNRVYTIGEKTHTVADWCKIYNIDKRVVYSRLYRKWNIEDALTIPVIERKEGRMDTQTLLDIIKLRANLVDGNPTAGTIMNETISALERLIEYERNDELNKNILS